MIGKCGSNWGWWIAVPKASIPDSWSADLRAGASGCTGGTVRGSVNVKKTGDSCFDVTYVAGSGYGIGKGQIHISCVAPDDTTASKGGLGDKSCNTPGQFNHKNAIPCSSTTKKASVCLPNGCTANDSTWYFIFHAETYAVVSDQSACDSGGLYTCS
jgi:hypothetical protein